MGLVHRLDQDQELVLQQEGLGLDRGKNFLTVRWSNIGYVPMGDCTSQALSPSTTSVRVKSYG